MIGKTNAQAGTPEPETGDWLVRYFDVDGTILKEQWVNNGKDATPPSNPNYDSTYLTFNTWNQVSKKITSNKDIGAIYNTVNNKTYAKIRLTTISGLSPTLYLNKSDSSTLTVDWGDGNTSTFTNSGNFNTGEHNYSEAGDYVITMWISSGSGTYSFGNGSESTTFVGGSKQNYRNTLLSLFIGNSVTSIGDAAFAGCFSLKSISIPNSVTSIGEYAFYNCNSLTYISIPNSVTSIGNGAFDYCYSLTSISIPNSVTSIGNGAFDSCYTLTSISIPNSVTSIGEYAFYSCLSLTSISIPNSVTSIGNDAFAGCFSLKSISIPNSVTSIGNSAFAYCYAILEYKIYATTPPTLSNINAFTNINSICKIYVPDASLAAYKTATNWVTYADYIYPLSDIGE